MKTKHSTQKISVSMTNELVGILKTAVQTGRYRSSSEVVREALRDWQAAQARERAETDGLKGLVQEGLESGDGLEATPAFFEAHRAAISKTIIY